MNQSRPDPKNHMKSWVLQWKGNTPTLEHSTWAPGYTPGHQETEQGAIAAEMVQLMQHIADFREKWVKINLLAEQYSSETPEEASAFGQFISVTEHDDPHEHMTMPEGAQAIEDELQKDADRESEMDDWANDIPDDMGQVKYNPGQPVRPDWLGEPYDDHQDH